MFKWNEGGKIMYQYDKSIDMDDWIYGDCTKRHSTK